MELKGQLSAAWDQLQAALERVPPALVPKLCGLREITPQVVERLAEEPALLLGAAPKKDVPFVRDLLAAVDQHAAGRQEFLETAQALRRIVRCCAAAILEESGGSALIAIEEQETSRPELPVILRDCRQRLTAELSPLVQALCNSDARPNCGRFISYVNGVQASMGLPTDVRKHVRVVKRVFDLLAATRIVESPQNGQRAPGLPTMPKGHRRAGRTVNAE